MSTFCLLAHAPQLQGSYAATAARALHEVLVRLRSVVGRFVLCRHAGAVELASLRERSTELNLYDLFASAE
jgi:hypothetical protein